MPDERHILFGKPAVKRIVPGGEHVVRPIPVKGDAVGMDRPFAHLYFRALSVKRISPPAGNPAKDTSGRPWSTGRKSDHRSRSGAFEDNESALAPKTPVDPLDFTKNGSGRHIPLATPCFGRTRLEWYRRDKYSPFAWHATAHPSV